MRGMTKWATLPLAVLLAAGLVGTTPGLAAAAGPQDKTEAGADHGHGDAGQKPQPGAGDQGSSQAGGGQGTAQQGAPMGPGMMGNMMGPGMMGPGMMGSGMMGGMMGHGGTGGCPMAPSGGMMGGPFVGGGLPGIGIPALPAPVTLDQAKGLLERRLSFVGNPRLKLGSVAEKDSRTIAAEIRTQDDALVQKLEMDRLTGQIWQAP